MILFILYCSTAFTKEETNSYNEENETGIRDKIIMNLWIVIYWISIVLNFIILKFQIIYWTQEHPNCLKRLFISVKAIKFRIICQATP